MNLEQKLKLNELYPVRLSLLKTGIQKNLEYAKQTLNKDGRKTRGIQIILDIVEEDLDDLENYYSKHPEHHKWFTTSKQAENHT